MQHPSPKNFLVYFKFILNKIEIYLGALPADATGKHHVLGADRDPLTMQGAEKGILEESNHVRLSGLLQSQDGAGLEAKFVAKLGRNFANEPLKG